MAKVRMLPPPNNSVVRHNTVITMPSGTRHDGTANPFVDAEVHEARILSANGWIPVCADQNAQVGATTSRPTTGLYPGLQYMDTTLGFIVTYDGLNWKRPDTGATA